MEGIPYSFQKQACTQECLRKAKILPDGMRKGVPEGLQRGMSSSIMIMISSINIGN
jgi:hypothetical protein